MKIITYFLFFVSYGLFGQTPFLDSLKLEVSSIEAVDTTAIDLRLSYIHKVIITAPSDSNLLPYTIETLDLAQDIQYPRGIVLANQRLGVIYQYFLAEPLKALKYYQEAAVVIEKNPKLNKYLPASLGNIGIIYYEQQDYLRALEIYRKMYQEFNRPGYIPEQYLGQVFGDLNELDSSMHYLNKSIERSIEEKNPTVEANSRGNLSKILLRAGRINEAVETIEKALELVEDNNIGLAMPAVYTNASEVYLKDRNYDLAEFYAKKSLKVPGLENNLFVQKGIYATLYDVYRVKNQYQKALEAHEKFKFFSDSLIAIDQRVEFTRKDLEFESERKELISKAEISRQKLINTIYSIGGGVALIVLILISFLIAQKRKIAIRVKETEFEKNLAESKLVALRTQLNPHFIFNALNSIDQYMISHGADQASNYLVKFSVLMRKILQNSNENWITLTEEMELMKVYVEIESLRLKEPLQMNVNIGKNIDQDNTMVPSLFIQPFVENSIEHGISKMDGQGILSVNINIDSEKRLTCIVEDNGVGRKVQSRNDNESKSMGIQIAKDRIGYLNQLTNNKTVFNIEDLEQGVRVTISIPHETKF